MPYAQGALRNGVHIFQHTPVIGLVKDGDRVTGVHTPNGTHRICSSPIPVHDSLADRPRQFDCVPWGDDPRAGHTRDGLRKSAGLGDHHRTPREHRR